jgi:hypothetical protein
MKIKYVCMRVRGAQRDRSEIAFKKKHAQVGTLDLRDTTDQGLHRMSRIARISKLVGDRELVDTLLDAQVLWVNEDSMMIAGFERVIENGVKIDYAQSWLCMLDLPAPVQPSLPLGRSKRDDIH